MADMIKYYSQTELENAVWQMKCRFTVGYLLLFETEYVHCRWECSNNKKNSTKANSEEMEFVIFDWFAVSASFFSSREHRTFTTNSFTHSFLHTSTWHNAMKSIAIHSALCYVILIYYLFHFLYSLKYTKCMQTIHGNPDWIRIFAPCLHS